MEVRSGGGREGEGGEEGGGQEGGEVAVVRETDKRRRVGQRGSEAKGQRARSTGADSEGGGSNYAAVITADCAEYRWAYGSKAKDEMSHVAEQYSAKIA